MSSTDDAMQDYGHRPHIKHLELGLSLDDLPDEDPVMLDHEDPEDAAKIDAIWDDATTVEQYETDLATLGALPAADVEALRQARHG